MSRGGGSQAARNHEALRPSTRKSSRSALLHRSHLLVGREDLVEVVEGHEGGVALAEDIAFEPVWSDAESLETHVLGGGDGEDVIEFFQRALFGFGDPEEDHDHGEHVETTM